MALKDTWKDLQDDVQGVPNSGDDASAEPINDIAHAVIDLEDNINRKEDVSNKVTKLLENATDEQYPSALAVKTAFNFINGSTSTAFDIVNSDIDNIYKELKDKENKSNKVTTMSDAVNDEQYPSAKAVKNYVDSSIQSAILDSWEVPV